MVLAPDIPHISREVEPEMAARVNEARTLRRMPEQWGIFDVFLSKILKFWIPCGLGNVVQEPSRLSAS